MSLKKLKMCIKTNMKICAVVPARAGSKGVPSKNIYKVCEVPLINYTLETLLKVNDIDTIIVSTDSDEIASVVKKYSPLIEVIQRPEELATDTASSDDVLLHVLERVNQKYTHFLYAEPTSPFRTIETIEKTISCLLKHQSTMTVVEDNSIFGYIESDRFVPLIKGEARRRQCRVPKYKEASVLYGILIDAFKKRRTIYDSEAYPIIISDNESLDINEYSDLSLMETKLKENI
jgi:CMP-N,N'-diacetyllegionaminic acid synthase